MAGCITGGLLGLRGLYSTCIAFFVVILSAQIKLHFSNEFSITLLFPKFFNVPCGAVKVMGAKRN